jgi:ATP-dependent protease ClpP protease subunit
MMPHNLTEKASDFRPQTSRCIEVIGEFNDDLAGAVLPCALKFRQESIEPITVYIHSRGGFVSTFEAIDAVLRTADPSGKDCLIITVAVGNVSSAASNLLVLGDYAYAYPESILLFHGTRLEEVQLTLEGARNMAAFLDNSNRRVARRITQSILPRVMFRLLQLQPKVKSKRIPQITPSQILSQFEMALSRRLSNPAKKLLDRVCKRVGNASLLTDKILSKLNFHRPTAPARQDARVLRAVIAHELRDMKGKQWLIDEQGMNRLAQDYFLLREFNVGRNQPLFYQAIMTWGPEFLTPSEVKQFNTLNTDKDKSAAGQFLVDKASPYIAPLWFFTVTLSHNLSVGENSITASDAYWLGLIDEVIGKNWKCPRLVMEEKEQVSATVPAVAAN